MDDIRMRLPRRDSSHVSPALSPTKPSHTRSKSSLRNTAFTSTGVKAIHYSSADLQSIKKIQQWWRRLLPNLLQHRTFLLSPKGEAFKRYSKLCTKYASGPIIRKYILYKGPGTYSKICRLQDAQTNLVQRVLQLILEADLTKPCSYEDMDTALREIRQVGAILKDQAEAISDATLAKMIETQDLLGLQRLIDAVKKDIHAAEKELLDLLMRVDRSAQDVLDCERSEILGSPTEDLNLNGGSKAWHGVE